MITSNVIKMHSLKAGTCQLGCATLAIPVISTPYCSYCFMSTTSERRFPVHRLSPPNCCRNCNFCLESWLSGKCRLLIRHNSSRSLGIVILMSLLPESKMTSMRFSHYSLIQSVRVIKPHLLRMPGSSRNFYWAK